MPLLELWGYFLTTSYWVVSTGPICSAPVHATCLLGTPSHSACLIPKSEAHAVCLVGTPAHQTPLI